MLIAEFSRVTSLSRDTIRFYVRKGLLTPQVGRSGTNRYQEFDDEQVERALLIREAQALGFTLREIAALSEEYARGMSLARQLELMRGRLSSLDEQAAKLARLRRYFAAKVQWLEQGARGEAPSFSEAVMQYGEPRPRPVPKPRGPSMPVGVERRPRTAAGAAGASRPRSGREPR